MKYCRLFGQKVCDLPNWILCLREHLNCLKGFPITKAAVVRQTQHQICLQVRLLTSFCPSQTQSLYAPSVLICNSYSRVCCIVGLYCKTQLLRMVWFTLSVLNCSQLNFHTLSKEATTMEINSQQQHPIQLPGPLLL